MYSQGRSCTYIDGVQGPVLRDDELLDEHGLSHAVQTHVLGVASAEDTRAVRRIAYRSERPKMKLKEN